MKKQRGNTADRRLNLQARDLASVRGGDGGVIHANAIVGGGISPHDDGVVHSRN